MSDHNDEMGWERSEQGRMADLATSDDAVETVAWEVTDGESDRSS